MQVDFNIRKEQQKDSQERFPSYLLKSLSRSTKARVMVVCGGAQVGKTVLHICISIRGNEYEVLLLTSDMLDKADAAGNYVFKAPKGVMSIGGLSSIDATGDAPFLRLKSGDSKSVFQFAHPRTQEMMGLINNRTERERSDEGGDRERPPQKRFQNRRGGRGKFDRSDTRSDRGEDRPRPGKGVAWEDRPNRRPREEKTVDLEISDRVPLDDDKGKTVIDGRNGTDEDFYSSLAPSSAPVNGLILEASAYKGEVKKSAQSTPTDGNEVSERNKRDKRSGKPPQNAQTGDSKTVLTTIVEESNFAENEASIYPKFD